MEEEKLTLGKKLQKLRKENKLSQVKLGEIINASDRTISKWFYLLFYHFVLY